MAVDYQQTATAAPHGNASACSGVTVSTVGPANRQIEEGGSADTSDTTVTVAGYAFTDSSPTSAIFLEGEALTLAGNFDVPAGDWVVNLNVVSGDSNLSVSSIHLCRMNTTGIPLQTIATISPAQSLASSQVYTFTLTTAGVTTFTPGDRLYVVISLANAQLVSGKSVTVRFDQVVTVPIEASNSSAAVRRVLGD